MRRYLLLAAVFGAGSALGAAYKCRPAARAAAPAGDPDSIEVYRAPSTGAPEVADTIRIAGRLGGDRDQWTVHVRYGDRVVSYHGAGLNRPPR